MNKFLKLTGVSMLAIVAASNAHAAGYTCEELIEYTSCSAGYYFACPDGSVYGTHWCVSDMNDVSEDLGEEECFFSGGDYLGTGCLTGDGMELLDGAEVWGFDGNASLVPQTCTECPVGSICAGGDVDIAVAAPCPAGSYCAGTGLSQPSGECAIGTYSMDGATECSQCPVTGLTDKNGATVVATTLSTGSTSPAACIVGEEYYFTDTKGTYHYKSDCAFKPWTLSVTTEAQCKSLNGDWEWDEDMYMCWSAIGGDNPTPTTYVTTQEVCENDVGDAAYWEDGVCYCKFEWNFDEYGLHCYV